MDGVGPKGAKALRELGLTSLSDLLDYFPRAYQTESPERDLSQLVPDEIQSARGEVVAVDYVSSRGRPRFEATLADAENRKLALVWFNASYLRSTIHPGQVLRVRGKVSYFRNLPQMANPKFEVLDDGNAEPHVESKYRAIYSASSKISSERIGTLLADNIDAALNNIDELFDASLLKKHRLLGRRAAYRQIHLPDNPQSAESARRRLIYDELMLMQLGLGLGRQTRDGRLSAPLLRCDKLLDTRIRGRFPFPLTDAQARAIYDIVGDVKSGRPMNRLLQGDVGSGKTVVALYAMLLAVANKMQAAILAPTEVLAEQHYLTLSRFLEGSSVTVELLTARSRRASRGSIVKRIRSGEIHLAIGTQAMIQEDVEFANLGMVVIDEQHKLGVKQRALLKSMGHSPHYLVMTATPIPRTLALSFFADFDVSVINELPPGRQPIETRWVRPGNAKQAYDFIRAQVQRGRQAYVVVPQVEDNGIDDAKSVKKEFDRLQKGPLEGLRLSMIHGRMDSDEKQSTMQSFRTGEIDVLIATTVIEVGVDVSNATVMLIDNADRFGLSQLHQLRGRVGRGGEKSHCILLSDANTDSALERLNAMVRSNDGFEIAEIDLKLRGYGEFFGTRQHGLPEMKLADITQELGMLQIAKSDALEILRTDPKLRDASHKALREALRKQFGDEIELSQVG